MPCYEHCFFINQDGYTALMSAACAGQHECLSILLAHGADVDKANAVSAAIPASAVEHLSPAEHCVWLAVVVVMWYSLFSLLWSGWVHSTHDCIYQRTS